MSFNGNDAQKITFSDTKEPTIFVGPNGVGKSNIIRAIVLVRDALTNIITEKQNVFNGVDSSAAIILELEISSTDSRTLKNALTREWEEKNDSSNIPSTITRVLVGYIQKKMYVLVASKNKFMTWRDGEYIGSELNETTIEKLIDIEALFDKHELRELRKPNSIEPSIIESPTLTPSEERKRKKEKERILSTDVYISRAQVARNTFLGALEVLLATRIAILPQHRQIVNPSGYYNCITIEHARAKLLDMLQDYRFADLVDKMNDSLKSIENCVLAVYANGGTHALYVRYNDMVLLLDQVSGATLEIIMILYSIYGDDQSIIVLDEPAANVDPSRQEQVIEKLLDCAKDKHIIVITHSNKFVQEAYLDAIHFVRRSENSYSMIKDLEGFWSIDLKKVILNKRAITHNFADILFARKVLLVEGVNDYRLVEAIKITKQARLKDVLVVSTEGCNKAILPGQLGKYLGIPIFALFDYDTFFVSNSDQTRSWHELKQNQSAYNFMCLTESQTADQIYSSLDKNIWEPPPTPETVQAQLINITQHMFCWKGDIESIISKAKNKVDADLANRLPTSRRTKQNWKLLDINDLVTVVDALTDDEEMKLFVKFLNNVTKL